MLAEAPARDCPGIDKDDRAKVAVYGLGFTRKVDLRLPGEGNSYSRGARPVHLIISMVKLIRTSRRSIQNSLSGPQ